MTPEHKEKMAIRYGTRSLRARRRVLVSAYACNPKSSLQLHPGEDFTGWRLVNQIGRFHELWVITHRYNEPGVSAALTERPLPNVRFCFVDLSPAWKWLYRIEFGQRIYYFLWQIKAWRVARRLHREVHFDLAHHLTFGNDWIPSFIGAFLPVPFVWGPVGGGQRTPKPMLREYSLYGRFAEAARNMAQWLGRRSFVRRRCLKKAKAALVCNRETRLLIPQKYADKIIDFPVNGISREDIKEWNPRSRDVPLFRIITAGRLHRLKGFPLAVRAFSLFAEKHPGSELIIIGKGPEENRLQALVRKLGVEEKVRILPWLPRDEVLANMRSSDVFLFPSFRDGGGAVVVEAMASSLPVIVLDSGGPAAHVQDSWGIKVIPKNREFVVQEMVQALERLYSDRDLRRRMGEAGRKKAMEFYTWEKLGERMRGIYDFALEGKAPADQDLKD